MNLKITINGKEYYQFKMQKKVADILVSQFGWKRYGQYRIIKGSKINYLENN